jgi:hypothetical protein
MLTIGGALVDEASIRAGQGDRWAEEIAGLIVRFQRLAMEMVKELRYQERRSTTKAKQCRRSARRSAKSRSGD